MTDPNDVMIVTICGDPGGASAVIPVIKYLHAENRVKLHVLAYRESRNIMEKKHLPFSVADEKMDRDQIRSILENNHASILITGTSINSTNLERKFIKIAKEMHIPSLAVLDFWSNYSVRFTDSTSNSRYIPDKIAIMDTGTRSAMIHEGFPPESLVVTGQPAFDDLMNTATLFNSRKKKEILRGFGIAPGSLVVSFFSQPLSGVYGADNSSSSFLGYSEKTVLALLLSTLAKISSDVGQEIILLIRPHPREKCSDYKHFEHPGIKVLVSQEFDSREIALVSDLVTGMNTELLVEACYMGCIVVSLQPGLRFNDCLPTNNMGYTIPVYSEINVENVIKTALLNQDFRSEMLKRNEPFRPDGHATERIVSLVYQMIENITEKGDINGKTGN